MVAKVIIRRRFLKDREREVLGLLNQMRNGAMKQPGYISGETLIRSDNPQKMTVIATWQSLMDWEAWKTNNERRKLEMMLEVYQDGPTQYEEYILGTQISRP
jgi:antibiotic biosynthesis monooxygenase (ABM) superfamily enzyme